FRSRDASEEPPAQPIPVRAQPTLVSQRTGAPSPAWRKGSSSSSQASPSAVAISDENCAGSPADRSMTERMRSSGTRMLPAESVKIGRASCREGEELYVDGVAVA